MPGEFIEGDDVPVANQADAPGRVINEEFCQRHLAARHEDAVGREFGVDMRFSGALGAQLDEVIVAFDVGNEAGQLEEFRASAELIGIETDRGDEQVDPLVGAERGAPRAVAAEIEARQLDGLKAGDDPRAGCFCSGISHRHVGHLSQTPDTTGQEAVILTNGLVGYQRVGDPEIFEGGVVSVVRFVKVDGDLVDNPILSLLANA